MLPCASQKAQLMCRNGCSASRITSLGILTFFLCEEPKARNTLAWTNWVEQEQHFCVTRMLDSTRQTDSTVNTLSYRKQLRTALDRNFPATSKRRWMIYFRVVNTI